MSCNSPEPDGNSALPKPLSWMLRHPGPVVRAVPSQDACFGLLALHKSLAIHPKVSCGLASEAEPVTPSYLPSRIHMPSPSQLPSHGELQSGGKSRGLGGGQPFPGCSTLYAIHEQGGPGKSFLSSDPSSSEVLFPTFRHHQKALKCFSENNPSTRAITLMDNVTSSPSFPLSFFLIQP